VEKKKKGKKESKKENERKNLWILSFERI